MESHRAYFTKLILGMIAAGICLISFIVFIVTTTTKGRDLTYCRVYNDLLAPVPKQELIALLSATPPMAQTPLSSATYLSQWRFLQLGDLYVPIPNTDAQALQIIQTPLPKDKEGVIIRIGSDDYIAINRSPNPEALSYGFVDDLIFEKSLHFQDMIREVLSKNFRNPCDPKTDPKLIVRDIISLWFKKSVLKAGFTNGQLLQIPHGFSFSRTLNEHDDTSLQSSTEPNHIIQIFFNYKSHWLEMEVKLNQENTKQFMELLPTMIYGVEEDYLLNIKDQEALTRYATFLGF